MICRLHARTNVFLGVIKMPNEERHDCGNDECGKNIKIKDGYTIENERHKGIEGFFCSWLCIWMYAETKI
jgi:hypothetical protein